MACPSTYLLQFGILRESGRGVRRLVGPESDIAMNTVQTIVSHAPLQAQRVQVHWSLVGVCFEYDRRVAQFKLQRATDGFPLQVQTGISRRSYSVATCLTWFASSCSCLQATSCTFVCIMIVSSECCAQLSGFSHSAHHVQPQLQACQKILVAS